jgi:hypothetical protein
MVAAGLPLLSRLPAQGGIRTTMGSIGGRAEPGGGAPLGDCATRAASEHPLSLHSFFSSRQTEPLFLAATMAVVVVVALDLWLPRVDLSPSWPDPSPGLWARGARTTGGGCQPRGPWGLGCPLFPPPLRQQQRPWRGGGSRRVCYRLWRRDG